jgi:F0F1-type ATP synthase assembly protein I
MFRLVVLQALVTVVVALVSWGVSGTAAAVSALLGGLACVVPNALFALRLWLVARQTAALQGDTVVWGAGEAGLAPAGHGASYAADADGVHSGLPAGATDSSGSIRDNERTGRDVARHMMAFFVGEFVKLALTFALLGAIATGYKDLVWVAMIIAVIATLKSYMLAPLLPR